MKNTNKFGQKLEANFRDLFERDVARAIRNKNNEPILPELMQLFSDEEFINCYGCLSSFYLSNITALENYGYEFSDDEKYDQWTSFIRSMNNKLLKNKDVEFPITGIPRKTLVTFLENMEFLQKQY